MLSRTIPVTEQLNPELRVDQNRLAFFVKRLLDLFVAVIVLILISPLLFLIAIAIRLDSEGNPFFVQERVGRWGMKFRLIKFRTMYLDRCGIVLGKEVYEGDDRVTPVGMYLRRFKFDELPQLINIVLGHMSLIGPRPDIPEQVEAYSEFQRQRLLIRPGLTGVAQVSGNIWLSWSERIVLDIWYIQNWSLLLELLVILHTIKVLIHGERQNADPFGLRSYSRLLSIGKYG